MNFDTIDLVHNVYLANDCNFDEFGEPILTPLKTQEEISARLEYLANIHREFSEKTGIIVDGDKIRLKHA